MSRPTSLAVMWAAYLWTIAIALTLGSVLPVEHPLAKAAVVDVIATVMIFAVSAIFNNSSVYDPFWSVAPMALAGYWVAIGLGESPVNRRGAIVLGLVVVWGVRLTANFLTRWRGMHDEDWRYREFRERVGAHYWVVSFFGFHLVPTLIVLGACLPLYFACTVRSPLGVIDVFALVVTLTGIVIETVADAQLRSGAARNDSGGRTFRGGLWRFSRHPNYFGEVLFWWGIFLFALGADPRTWWTATGPLGVTILFLVVSLPLMETRMALRRSDYEDIQAEVSLLIPWFPRKG